MSSFVVENKTIDIIVSALKAATNGNGNKLPKISEYSYGQPLLLTETLEDAASIGETLHEMNVNATSQRYNGEQRETLPGTHKDGVLERYAFQSRHAARLQVYVSLSCYLYQCSEGDVDKLPLFAELEQWKNRLACNIAHDAAADANLDHWG